MDLLVWCFVFIYFFDFSSLFLLSQPELNFIYFAGFAFCPSSRFLTLLRIIESQSFLSVPCRIQWGNAFSRLFWKQFQLMDEIFYVLRRWYQTRTTCRQLNAPSHHVLFFLFLLSFFFPPLSSRRYALLSMDVVFFSLVQNCTRLLVLNLFTQFIFPVSNSQTRNSSRLPFTFSIFLYPPSDILAFPSLENSIAIAQYSIPILLLLVFNFLSQFFEFEINKLAAVQRSIFRFLPWKFWIIFFSIFPFRIKKNPFSPHFFRVKWWSVWSLADEVVFPEDEWHPRCFSKKAHNQPGRYDCWLFFLTFFPFFPMKTNFFCPFVSNNV